MKVAVASVVLLCFHIFVVYGIVTKARVHLIHAAKSISDDGGTTDAGVLDFTQTAPNAPVHINGTISGVKPKGKHGFHIHSFGDVDNSCTAAGAHFNPHNHTHGAPHDATRHVGDLGNVEADENGDVTVDMDDSIISLSGANSIIGRSVVVHQKTDDLGVGKTADSKTTGNAGTRLACGIIGITDEVGGPAPTAAAGSPAIGGRIALYICILLFIFQFFGPTKSM